MNQPKIKLCGLTRVCDILWANELEPEYIGFVFAKKSKRYADPELAAALKAKLNAGIKSVGVFVNEPLENVAVLLKDGVIDIAQLHGSEDEEYIHKLKELTGCPLIKAFRIDGPQDVIKANSSPADFVLLDSGAGGTGTAFDWTLLKGINRPYFLAGGLNPDNVTEAVKMLSPYALDVSSGIETDGLKDKDKMTAFVKAARKQDNPERK